MNHPIPRSPFFALYGSHSSDWRDRVARRLDERGIASFDPSDSRWRKITPETGDDLQELVDRLVARQWLALQQACGVIFHLGASHVDPETNHYGNHPAARFELGLIAGCPNLPAFVHVSGEADGRNYLRAQLHLHRHLRSFDTLEEATEAAIQWFQAGHPWR